ncbi:uncharacterized protein LOC114818835, partial [Antrostomus carolinensis]|uniref:uncharacterized protein LOC114818835 n=1 Tax=Antrostomus carolinensis TaxID=279965 RepID=UPI0010A984B3
EYYRVQYPHEHQSTETSPWENELLLLEATKPDLEKGDGDTIPETFNNTKREGESSGKTVPTESIPTTDCQSFENGETNHTELAKDHHYEEEKEKEKVSEEPRNSFNTVTDKGIHTSDHKVKQSWQRRGHNKDGESASSVLHVRETGKKKDFNTSEPRRSVSVFCCSVTFTREPKFSGSTAAPEPYGRKCSKQKNQLDTNRRFWTQMKNYDKHTDVSYNAPAWKKRNPHAKMFPKFKTTVQQRPCGAWYASSLEQEKKEL